METRYIPTEMRVDEEGRIEGYAAVFGEWSERLWYFREKIRRGAFAKTLQEADVRALFNHDPNYVLGRNKASTLNIWEDDHGLGFRVQPPDAQWANDLMSSIKRGDINQASFAFDAIRDEWDYNVEPNERELIEVRLYDVSVVTYPAYPQTSVSARSLAQMFINQMKDHVDPDALVYMRSQLAALDEITDTAPGQEPHPVDEETISNEQERARSLDIRRMKLELSKRRNYS